MNTLSRLNVQYQRSVIPALRKKLGIENIYALPRISRVVVSVGVGSSAKEAKDLETVAKTLEKITGQKPIRTKAKKSIAAFKIRQGMPIGLMVTLRGPRMADFLEKLIHAALPRVRDFQGLSPRSFGRSGTYTIGLKEHLVFPEISGDTIDRIHGLSVTIVTTAKNPETGLLLLKSLGLPFRETA